MTNRPLRIVAILLLAASTTCGQVTAPPASPTLWSFLGVPQGLQKIKGAVLNRKGKHPKLEPTPATKAIADLANLESPVEAIKKAAEIKVAEDLKPQKIKAIRYLTRIGCGCYDKDGSITAALIAASDDCTPDVRLTVMEEVHRAVRSQCCSECGSTCCCNEKMAKRLAEIAYHKDETGCYLEPNEEIRNAAQRALFACCPNESPVVEISDEEPETVEDDYQGESGDDTYDGESEEGDDAEAEGEGESAGGTQEAAVGGPSASVAWDGVLLHVDENRGIAHVHLQDRDALLPVGSQLRAYGRTEAGIVPVGTFTVYQAFKGSANVQIGDEASRQALVKGVAVIAQPVAQPAVAQPTVAPQPQQVAQQPPSRVQNRSIWEVQAPAVPERAERGVHRYVSRRTMLQTIPR